MLWGFKALRACHFCKGPIPDDESAIQATTKNGWAHFVRRWATTQALVNSRPVWGSRGNGGPPSYQHFGLCSDKSHADEFYVPDPKPGEACPWCERKLVHYRRTTYRVKPRCVHCGSQVILPSGYCDNGHGDAVRGA